MTMTMSHEMPRQRAGNPPFPWTFLSEPEGTDAELAALWIFLNPRATAYRDFPDAGTGVLIGPFLSDDGDLTITTGEALRRRADNQLVGSSVRYLPVRSSQFPEVVPAEPVRETIYHALDGYDPQDQCVVLLRHDETAVSVSVIGVEETIRGTGLAKSVSQRRR